MTYYFSRCLLFLCIALLAPHSFGRQKRDNSESKSSFDFSLVGLYPVVQPSAVFSTPIASRAKSETGIATGYGAGKNEGKWAQLYSGLSLGKVTFGTVGMGAAYFRTREKYSEDVPIANGSSIYTPINYKGPRAFVDEYTLGARVSLKSVWSSKTSNLRFGAEWFSVYFPFYTYKKVVTNDSQAELSSSEEKRLESSSPEVILAHPKIVLGFYF